MAVSHPLGPKPLSMMLRGNLCNLQLCVAISTVFNLQMKSKQNPYCESDSHPHINAPPQGSTEYTQKVRDKAKTPGKKNVYCARTC